MRGSVVLAGLLTTALISPVVESKCKGGVPDDSAAGLPNERIGLAGGDGDNTGTGDDTGSGGDTGSDGDGIGGSGGEGIWGSGDDHGESGDDGGVDIARSLATSASDHTGVGTGAGIEILAVTRYAGCGGGVVADSSVSNDSVSSADEA
ncbi:hypothetical protein Tco_0713286 [Tanacetum coccineum]